MIPQHNRCVCLCGRILTKVRDIEIVLKSAETEGRAGSFSPQKKRNYVMFRVF